MSLCEKGVFGQAMAELNSKAKFSSWLEVICELVEDAFPLDPVEARKPRKDMVYHVDEVDAELLLVAIKKARNSTRGNGVES